jgi:2-keto-4-pentenoate hydratase/2-oxohepta-3-ene-1,7-dioic acid hydratase in catechol pathway
MKPNPYRLASYLHESRDRVGIVIGSKMVDIDKAFAVLPADAAVGRLPTMLTLLQKWPEVKSVVADAAAHLQEHPDALSEMNPVEVGEVDLLSPIPNPGKIINAGLNFYDHAREMGFESLPEGFQPNFFSKGDSSSVIGPAQSIILSSSFVDWEAELAVVIGRQASRVSVDEAMDCVAGYTCHNDITDRGLMMKPDGSLDFFAGKFRDTFAPLGPFFVPADQMPDLDRVRIRCRLNDELMQDFGMDQIVWGPAECIAHISGIVTLMPGDVIGLGTGAGTGWAKGITIGPGQITKLIDHMLKGGGTFLRSGDRVAVEIAPIGRLENGVTRYE